MKRAVYEARHCWSPAMNLKPQLSSPKDWGWYKKAEGGWEACWTMLPEASGVCRELICCGCKKSCRGQCKCLMTALQALLFANVVGFALNDSYANLVATYG